MKKILFRLLLLFTTLLSVSSSYANDYFSNTDGDASDVNNWNSDRDGVSGSTPVNFTNPSDVFYIQGVNTMYTTIQWNVAGIVHIETNGVFDANTFDNTILLNMDADAKYVFSGSASSSYNNLTFGLVDNSSIFSFEYTNVAAASAFRYLNYPTLVWKAPRTLTLSADLTINGDFVIENTSAVVNTSGNTPRILAIGGGLNVVSGIFRGANGSASSTITISGDISITGGTFIGSSSAGSPSITARDFNQSGGTFQGVSATANGNPTINLSGNFNQTAGTYTAKVAGAGTGRVTFVMNGPSKTINLASFTSADHKFTINSTIGLAGNFTIANVLTIGASGNLSINAHTLTIGGSLVNSGTLTGGASSEILFNSTASGATLPAVTLNSLTVSTIGQTITLGGDVLVNDVSITSGELSIGSNTLTLDGTISNSGTFTGGSSSNIVIGTSAVGLSLPAVTLNNLTVNASTSSAGGAVTVNGTITLNTGTFNPANLLTMAPGSNIVVVGGTLSGVPTFAGTVNVTYSGSGNNTGDYEIPSSASALSNITFAKSGGIVSLNHPITVNGTLTITSGSLNSAGFSIDAKGDWINNSTYTATSNTVTFSGTGTQTLSGSLSPAFHGLTIDKSSGSLILNKAITASNTLSMTTGTLDNSSSNITLGNGATIVVDQGTLQATPIFGTTVNVSYIGAGDMVANNSLPTASTVLNNVTFGKIGTVTIGHAITVNGTLTISSGALDTDVSNNYAITLKGDWINNGSFVPNTSISTFSGSSTQTISGTSSTSFGSLTINKTSGSLALGAPISASGTVSLTAGTIDNSSNQISLGNGATVVKDAGFFQTAPTFGTSVNVQYTGNGSISVGNEMPTSSTVLNNVTFAKTGTVTLTNPMTVNGILTISSGVLNTDGASNFAIDAKGNWINNGTFTVNSSPVTFSGTTTISGSSSHDFAALTISGTLTAPSAINVSGNFTNNGTFTHNSGTVTLAGSSSSNLAGSQKTSFYNLVLGKSAGVTIAGDSVKIDRLINITSGTLTTNNKLVLTATSDDNYASLIDASTSTPNGSVTGNIVFHRILDARGGASANGNAAMYSSPFSNGTVSIFQPTTKNFFFLNAATASFSLASSTGQSLSQGEGFSRRGAKFGESNYLIGTPSNGNISPSITTSAAGTWNLVGNPYPSTIDWSLVTKSNLGGSNAAYLFNGASWNAITSGNISVAQGFQVLALTGATLQFTNTARNSTPTSFLRVAQDEQKLSIHLKGLTGLEDESFILMNKDAKDQFDVLIDAPKLFPSNADCPGLALLKSNNKTVIYHLNESGNVKSIPIYSKVNKAGKYPISFEGTTSLNSVSNLYLNDKKTNTIKMIDSDILEYPIELDPTDTLRYELLFDLNVVTSNLDLNSIDESLITCYSKNKVVYVKNLSKEPIDKISIFNLNGIKVYESTSTTSNISMSNVSNGVYLVKLETSKNILTKKIILE